MSESESETTRVKPLTLSPAARRQKQLAPAKFGYSSRDPRRLFADSTVRSRVRVLFETVPSLSEWEGDGEGQQRRVPLAHMRTAVRRYVVLDMVYWRMMQHLVNTGEFDATLLDRALRVAGRLDTLEDRLGITRDSRRRETPGIPWGAE